jgi:hypothetical protein
MSARLLWLLEPGNEIWMFVEGFGMYFNKEAILDPVL